MPSPVSSIQVKTEQIALPYGVKEEFANTLSHGIGVVLGVVGSIVLLFAGTSHLTALQLTGVSIYGASFIILFLCSTLYHGVKQPRLKQQLKIADHCAIYLLIAGTYTPLMLIGIEGPQTLWVLSTIWSLAFAGIALKTIFVGRFKKLSLVLYLSMGWLCLTVINDLIASLSEQQFELLLGGGILYSLGVIFYVGKKIAYNHAIWHLFVLAGACSHFYCIYLTIR